MKDKKKIILNGVFLLLVFGLTLYGVFKGEEIPEIIASLHFAKKGYLIAGLFLVIIFVCTESVIIYSMMKSLRQKIHFSNCIKYSFIGFFFSCITPSATGGQPAQIYYMKKDKISIPVSTLILMIVTIGYKLVLVAVGLILLLFQRRMLDQYMTPMTNFFLILGMILNIIGIGGLLVLVFEPTLAKKIVRLIQTLLLRFHFIRKENKTWMESMDRYHETAAYFRTHGRIMFRVFYLSVFQRFCLFYVTYLVYHAFGLHGTSAYVIIMLQAVISLSVDMLPLPGGMGASESLFRIVFKPIFGNQLILPSLVLSRGISYYALLLISAVITCYAHFTIGVKKRGKLFREL